MHIDFNCQKKARARNVFPLVCFVLIPVWLVSNDLSGLIKILEDFKTFYLLIGFNV